MDRPKTESESTKINFRRVIDTGRVRHRPPPNTHASDALGRKPILTWAPIAKTIIARRAYILVFEIVNTRYSSDESETLVSHSGRAILILKLNSTSFDLFYHTSYRTIRARIYIHVSVRLSVRRSVENTLMISTGLR